MTWIQKLGKKIQILYLPMKRRQIKEGIQHGLLIAWLLAKPSGKAPNN